MTGESVRELFGRAQELEGAERDAFLRGIGNRDPMLARELEELLRAGEREDSPFERLPYGLEELCDPTESLTPSGSPELAVLPAAIGPYRILREIGRGGMGCVYLAVQRGEGFERQVAIKRLDRREASPVSERRFRDEVKFLAALEHPGIARFLDGGRAADGSAYIALEYVEGEDLLTHSRQQRLAVNDRLRLFIEVLAAVEYAHERKIVHRDLKPGNVLVGADGHPRLLDFGISKLVDPDAGGGADCATTRTELRALTPAYASPEQIRGGPVTVASDVYSLGVVLYELVAGVRPFQLVSGNARALERAVLEQEPEPPSTAARRASGASSSPSERPLEREGGVSDASTADPADRLGRDLDAICLKALRKEPGERYPSVGAFAADLRRLLAGHPVEARRGGVSYRLAKLARRHRVHLAVATAAALLAALAVLLAVRGTPVSRGQQSPQTSQIPAPRARPTLAPIGELSARFAEHPDRPEIGLELIAALLAAGRGDDAMGALIRLRQLPDPLGKGPRIDLAEASAALAVSEYQRAAAAATAALDGAAREGDGALGRRAQLLRARALLRLSPPEEAERLLASLVVEAEAAGDEATAVAALVVRAAAARKGSRAEEASRLLEAALPRARALGDPRLEAEAMTLAGRLQGESGEIQKGLATLERALVKAVEVGDLASEASVLQVRMALLNWSGDTAGAIATGQLAIQRLRISGDREQLLTVLGNLAITKVETGEFREAEAAIAEAEPVARALGSPRHRGTILRARGYLEETRGNNDAARVSYTAAVAAGREAGVDSVVAVYLSDLAWLELNAERYGAAAVAAEESVDLYRRGGDERSALEVAAVLACVDAASGKPASARRRLAALAAAVGESDSESARFVVRLAEARVAELLDERTLAVELRRETVRMAETFGQAALVLAQRANLALALDRAGERDEALAIARELLPEAERIGRGDVVRDCRRILDGDPVTPARSFPGG